MTSFALTKTVVFDERMYSGRGVVDVWLRRLTAAFVLHAKEHAPVNKRSNTGHGSPGALMRSIEGDVSRIGARQMTGNVSVNVPYALFVLRGTRSMIYSHKGFRFAHGLDKRLTGPFKTVETKKWGEMRRGKKGYFMRLPLNPMFRGGNSAYKFQVHGQPANNFLVEGFNATARTHRSLHAFVPGVEG
jgi:hypothetical protein